MGKGRTLKGTAEHDLRGERDEEEQDHHRRLRDERLRRLRDLEREETAEADLK